MTDKTVMPVYALIDYAYAVLYANDPTTWDKANYEGLIPIVPLNEEPELSEFDGPRIIYDFSLGETGTTYYKGRGVVTFAIRDHNYRRLTRAMNILTEAFKRHDESARDVNDFIERLALKNPPIIYDISFGHLRLGFAESGTPEEEEGGMMVGVVSVAYDYFDDYTLNLRPPV